MSLQSYDPIQPGKESIVNTPYQHWQGKTTDRDATYIEFIINEIVYTAAVDAQGNWEFRLPVPLAEGGHNLTARFFDASGNAGAPIQTRVVVDISAPEQPQILTVFDDEGAVTGPVGNQGFTDDNTPTLRGFAEPDSIVRVYSNGTLLGSVQAGKNGQWSYEPTLNDGEHRLYVTAADQFGQVSEESPVYTLFVNESRVSRPQLLEVYDNQGANQGIINAGESSDDRNPRLSGSAALDAEYVIIYANGVRAGIALVNNGYWQWEDPQTQLALGENTLTVRAVNNKGEFSDPSDPFTYTVAAPAPVIPLVIEYALDDVGAVQGQLESGGVTDDFSPLLVGSAEANSLVYIYASHENGSWVLKGSVKADAAGYWQYEVPALVSGEGLYHFQVSDTATRDPDAPQFDLSVSASASTLQPTITQAIDDFGSQKGVLGNNAITDDRTPTLQGTGVPGAIIEVDYRRWNGKWASAGSVKVDANGNWTLQTPEIGVEGPYHYHARTVNGAEKSSWSPTFYLNIFAGTDLPPEILYAVDNVGAVQGNVSNSGQTDDSTPTLKGKGVPRTVIEIEYRAADGSWQLAGSVKANSSGDWTFQSPLLPSGGTWEYHARTVNGSNKSAWSQSFVLNLEGSFDVIGAEGKIWNFNDGTLQGWTTAGKYASDNEVSVKKWSGPNNSYELGSATGNGAVSGFDTEIVYRYVQVEAGKFYEFGYDGARLDNQGGDGYYAPKIGLLVDGQEVIAPRDMPYGWQHYKGVYHATETKVVRVAVVNKTSSGSGNDFALDNIGIKPVSVQGLIPQIENAVDDFGSVTGNVSSNGITDDRTPTLQGKGIPDTVIEVEYKRWNGQWASAGSVKVDANGNWTLQTPEIGVEGPYNYHARTVVGAEKSSWSPNFNLNIFAGTDLPPEILYAVDNVGVVQGNVSNNGQTDDSTPTLKGKGVPRTVIEIEYRAADGSWQLAGSVQANSSGDWTLQSPELSSTGVWEYRARTVNGSNKSAWSQSFVLNFADSFDVIGAEGKIWNFNDGTLQGWTTAGKYASDNEVSVKKWSGPNHSYELGSATGNGAVSGFDTEIVYRYVQVEAGKYYQFGYDGARLDNQGGDGYYAPKIGLLVDGQEVIAPRDMPYGWQYYQGVYHATETKVVRVAVVNKTSSGSGNDFALDNIGIKPVSVEELKPQIENAVDDVGSVTGNVSNNGITDDKTPTLKGTGVPGAVIEIQYGKSGEPWGPAGTATVDANGNWTFTSPELTSNGVWEYRARTVIGAENSAWTDKFVLNVVGNVDAIGDQGNIWNFNDGTLQGWTTVGKYASDNEAYVKKWSGPNNSYELGSATGNGAVSGFDTEIVYRYVQVEAGKYYQFGYDGARLDNQGGDGYYAPKIGLLVDGQEVIAPRDMPYGWQYYQGVYHATETKVVRVAVVNKTSSGSGNDFALDNIGIKPVSAETVAPEIQHVIDNFGSVTGNISNNGITDDKTPTLKGKGVPGAVIEIEYGKEFAPWGLAGTTIVDANGNWTFSSPTLSSSGTWEYRARTVKGSEKGSWSEEFRLIVVNSDTFIIGDRAQVWNFNDGTLQGWKKYGKYNKGNEIQVKPWSGSGNSNEVGSYTNDKTTSGYNGDVIYRDVLVEKGQVYQLEFDAKRVENWHSAPKLGIKIDGQQVIPHTTLNGSWKHLVGQYVATETKVVKVAITSGVATGNGNDFTLDNIGIKALAPAQTDAELNPNGKSGRSALFELIDQQSDSHAVDLTNDTHNTVDVDIATLLQHGEDNLFIEDGKTQMRITGDSEDTVRLDTLLDGQTAEGTWAQQNGTLTVAGVAYNVYSHSGAEVEVLVQEGVKTEFM